MTYNLQNSLDVQNAKTRLEMLIKKGSIVEVTEKKIKRTLSQNNYLHLILSYFASQTGNRMEWVKQQYYKRTCNPDLFVGTKTDKILGSVKYIKSSTELDTGEMTLSIERFRNWASAEAGIYIPEPHEDDEIELMRIEVERHKEWLY